jgi:hypothetical protein
VASRGASLGWLHSPFFIICLNQGHFFLSLLFINFHDFFELFSSRYRYDIEVWNSNCYGCHFPWSCKFETPWKLVSLNFNFSKLGFATLRKWVSFNLRYCVCTGHIFENRGPFFFTKLVHQLVLRLVSQKKKFKKRFWGPCGPECPFFQNFKIFMKKNHISLFLRPNSLKF